DDDWPQLPPPDWPPLPAYLPAVPAAGPGVAADGSGPSSASLLARTGLLDVLIPWTTLTGRSREPAVLGRIGPISSWQARELLALATRNPATQWRVILTSDDGRALAVQHARPPRHTRISPAGPAGQGMTGVIGRVTITIRASTLSTPAAQPRPDSPLTIQHIAPAILAAAVRAAESGHRARHDSAGAGGCGHHMASGSYRPPPRIREWVAARDRTCRFGPCGQPAWRTDIDHTIPWHKGGPTCPCNLGGCCRTHHQIKQLPGWHLHQPQPGTFTWTTPASRTYHTQPDPYPV
ncbi:MAG TPA: HNH endonuclease signature motif containing protein, partial [Streptosporangiaceae bacterium]|nr:HNH endonuclease signature motif containing protein [Streptosporangiaceae bacterium]